jgi:hypothetical protein
LTHQRDIDQVLRTHKDLAHRLARNLTKGDKYLGQVADDIANRALIELARRLAKENVENPGAFMMWKMKNLKWDYLRQRKSEMDRLMVWNDELQAARGKRLADVVDTRRQWLNTRGLSLEVISREEQQMADLQALAMAEIVPNAIDREVLRARFYDPDLSISDIAREFTDRSPTSLANHLRKLLGTIDEPGALTPVQDVVGGLSLATARALCNEIVFLDDKDAVSNPIPVAIAHFEIAGTYSPAHRERAAVGIGHLRWIERNQPSNRGMPNKVLNRLIRAACFYVIEPNDARHDEYDDLGLHDDVKVVAAVQQAVRDNRNR